MRRPKSPFPVSWLGAIAIVTLFVLPMAPSAPAHASASPPAGPCQAEVPGRCGPALATLRPHPSAGVVAGNWTQLFPSSAPSDRTQPAISYDPTIQAVVLFGGYDPALAAVGDTWTFSNNTWTQISSNLTVAPPARWGATMVWDAADGYLLLFGGRNTGVYFNDTWTFNGTAWSNVASSVTPPPRSLFEMAYDPADREVIVDGGARLNFSSGAWGTVNDTWAYAAGTWTNISSAAPGGALDRAAGQASYDPWNGSVVFVGGGSTVNWTFGCTPIDPVQTYMNRSWYEYPSSVGPPQISQTMMTYDPAGPYLFLFGGFEPSGTGSYASCIQTNATWVRLAGVWYNLTGSLSASPGLRYLSGIAFDPVLDEVLLFGGNGNNAYLGDTWVYRIPSLDTILQASRIYGIAPLSVRFYASTVGGLAASGWNWSFGDGTTSTIGPSVNHTYASVGVYNASVNVTGSAGGYFVTNVTIDVAPILQAMGSASRTLGSVPFAVTFNGSASGGFAPYRYNWTFGDGGRAAVANVTHTYTTPGNFTAQLRVVDHEGDTNASSVRVDVGPQLVTTAVASVRRGVTPLWVNFTSTTTGGTGSDTYLWTFGDGSFSSLPDPTHEYLRTGNFTVVLNATDSLGRTATSSIPLVVLPALAASVETAATTGVAPFSLTFVAVVNGGDAPYTDTWNFGDGTPATTGISVGYTFVDAGSFLVELSVGDALGDAARAVETVNVVAPLSAKLAASVATGEAPALVAFSLATFTGGASPYAFEWTFGDGTVASGGSAANHTYDRAGSYTAKLTITDGLGEAISAQASIEVLPSVTLSVVSGFGSVYQGSEVNLTVRSAGGESPYSYSWVGLPAACASEDASTLACIPSTAGTYEVAVTVTDGLGRSAVANGTVVVVATQGTSPPTPSSGGSFPIGYAIGALVVAAVAIALVAVWAGRRRGRSGAPPSSTPDGPFERYAQEAPDEGTGEPRSPPS